MYWTERMLLYGQYIFVPLTFGPRTQYAICEGDTNQITKCINSGEFLTILFILGKDDLCVILISADTADRCITQRTPLYGHYIFVKLTFGHKYYITQFRTCPTKYKFRSESEREYKYFVPHFMASGNTRKYFPPNIFCLC